MVTGNIVSLGCRGALRALKGARSAPLQALFLALLVPLALIAADPILFPAPLHLTREVHDPVSDTITVVEEYYHGSRVISIRGDLTSIADYQKSELTEIDRAQGTYSISRFDEVARALQIGSPPSMSRASSSADSEAVRVSSAGTRQVAGRQADLYQVEQSSSLSATIALDRVIIVSRDAFDVLTGAAYPNRASSEHRMLAAAARGAASASKQQNEEFRLPLEQVMTYRLDGEPIRFRSTVIRLDQELPPPDLLVIPRGAQRVEGAWVQRARMYQTLIEP